MSHEKIKRLFEAELMVFASQRSMRVSTRNAKFTPVTNETYFVSEILPAVTDSLTLGGDHRLYIGLYQITIVTPLNVGTKVATDLAEDLSELFKLNKLYGADNDIQIIKPLYIPEGDVEGAVYKLPTHFRYRCDSVHT